MITHTQKMFFINSHFNTNLFDIFSLIIFPPLLVSRLRLAWLFRQPTQQKVPVFQVKNYGVCTKVIGFVSTTSALFLFLLAFISGFALHIAAASSNDTGEINKTETDNLEGDVDKSEDLVVEKKKTKTKTTSEDSSNTHESAENTEPEEYDADVSNNGCTDGQSSNGSETSEESTIGTDRPSAPNNTPDNSDAGSEKTVVETVPETVTETVTESSF